MQREAYKYGVAYSVRGYNSRCLRGSMPFIKESLTKEQALSEAKKMKSYMQDVIPFENVGNRKEIDWDFADKYVLNEWNHK